MAQSSGQTTPLLGSSPDQYDAELMYQATPSSGPGSLLRGLAPDANVVGIARLKRSLKRKGGAFGAPRARRMTWLCIDSRGEKSFMHVDKRALISRVGLSIPIRDMRLLDHSLAISDSVILVRENAIIASLEHVRLIIMHDKVLIPREGVEQSDLAGHFVDTLDEAVQEWFDQKAHFEEQLLRQTMHSPRNGGHASTQGAPRAGYERYDETSSMSDVAQDIEPLPFELVVLEAALKEVIGAISIKVADIEQVTMPAMDALMKSVTPNNLECVRKVKTRLQRITGRCEAVRDELERFLQDDEDMDRMCLTRKKEIEEELIMIRRENVSIHSASAADLEGGIGRDSTNLDEVGDASDVGYGSGGMAAMPVPERSQRGVAVPVALGTSHRRGFLTRQSLNFNQREMTPGAPKSPGLLYGGNGVNAAGQQLDEDFDADADAHLEVENLLESYFMQVDSMHDKLVALGSYIEDSEELLQFELDSSRNRLIRFEVILTVATFAIMPFNIVSGMLGENLKLPDEILGDTSRFTLVNIISGIASCFIFATILWYMRKLKI